MLTAHSVKIQSVSELTKSLRGLLETQFPFVTVTGEISNLRRPHSGHLYFTLKDDEARLRGVLFKQHQRYLDIRPENGMQVICRGRISVYEARGEYQLLIDSLESQGAGQLQIAFEDLKNKLAQEGLFDQSIKRPLPFIPERISLITSPKGAAVHDFIQTAEKRYPGLPIEIFPVTVQGKSAAPEIIDAIDFLNRRQLSDIIVLCRGGGSIEDLWAFNDEKLARAIRSSQIPVVSAIGHEIDFTISDFAADFRAATPTAAAEAVIPDKKILRERVFRAERAISAGLAETINRFRSRIDTGRRILGDPTLLLNNYTLKLDNLAAHLAHKLERLISGKLRVLGIIEDNLREANPGRVLNSKRQRITELSNLGKLLITRKIDRERDKLGKITAMLDGVSPLGVLARGYSITLGGPEWKAIKDSSELSPGDKVEVILNKGSFEAEISKTRRRTNKKNRER